MKFRKLLMLMVAVLSFVACSEKKEEILNFSLPNLTFPTTGSEKEIQVICDGEWSITNTGEKWIESITPMSGKGTTVIKVKTTANESGTRRTSEIGVNKQSFLIIQEIGGNVDINKLHGVWATEDGNFKFTFNKDLTCIAEMSIVPQPINGTYELEGNIITISVLPRKIIIVINDITEKMLTATTSGTTLNLMKK